MGNSISEIGIRRQDIVNDMGVYSSRQVMNSLGKRR